MIEVDVSGDTALRLHRFLGLVTEHGGQVTSRLVSEEDIELCFEVGPVQVETRVVGWREPVTLMPGDRVRFRYMLHLAPEQPMQDVHRIRFER